MRIRRSIAILALAVAGSATQTVAVPAPADARYSALHIDRPRANETLHDNSGRVNVALTLRPPLRTRDGHVLRVLLDNELLDGSWTQAPIELTGVDRGTHDLQVIVVDTEGRRLAASTPVEFHLWRASRLLPSRQPALGK
jgi:hypothetical protein